MRFDPCANGRIERDHLLERNRICRLDVNGWRTAQERHDQRHDQDQPSSHVGQDKDD